MNYPTSRSVIESNQLSYDARASSFSGELGDLAITADHDVGARLGRWAGKLAAIHQLGDIEGKTILDLGCGMGEVSAYIAVRAGGKVIGLDVSEVGLKVAKLRSQVNGVSDKLSFVEMDALKLGFASNTFDGVIGIHILHHLTDLNATAVELHRVLKNGGQAVFLEPLGDNLVLEWIRNHQGFPFYRRGTGTEGERMLTRNELGCMSPPFDQVTVIGLDLVYMFEKIVHNRSVRRMMRRCDDSILKLAPGLRQFCGRGLVRLRK